MRVSVIALAMAGLVAWSTASWAGGACCASKAKKEARGDMASCSKLTAGLNLSDEQKARVDEIEAACKAAGSTPEACAKSLDDIRALLDDDQKAQFDAACKKTAKKGGSCGPGAGT